MGDLELLPSETERFSQPTMVDVEGQRAIAEVQAAVLMAKRFPRNQKKAYENIMLACQRPSLAESAIYEYARGGTAITGPSIRLAEALAQNWGNIQFGIRELEQRNGESTVEAYAWDIETNTRQTKTFQVPHKRHTKKGAYSLDDPRDIYELVANNGARRLRACILGVIPGDVVDAAVAQCEETLKAKADTSPEATRKLVEAFKAFGVNKEHIEKRLQRNLDAITPAQIVGMRKIYNSLKDGMSSVADWFEVEPPKEAAKGVDGLKARLSAKGKEEVGPVDHELSEFNFDSPGSPQTLHKELADDKKEKAFEFRCFDLIVEIKEAKVSTALDLIQNTVEAELKHLPEDYKKACDLIDARRKALLVGEK